MLDQLLLIMSKWQLSLPLSLPPKLDLFAVDGSRSRDQNSALGPAKLLIRWDEQCETENGIPVMKIEKRKIGV